VADAVEFDEPTVGQRALEGVNAIAEVCGAVFARQQQRRSGYREVVGESVLLDGAVLPDDSLDDGRGLRDRLRRWLGRSGAA